MNITDLFLDHLQHFETTAPAPPELLPSRLASCCFEVLPVSASAISIVSSDGLRFPIGASTPRAAYAERLQFSTGEGPCLDLTPDGPPIIASGIRIFQCWPQFNARLVGETSYRAVAAFPMIKAGQLWASVDLFFASEAALQTFPVDDATSVVDLINAILIDAVGERDPRINNPISAARLVTLSAMDMVMVASGGTATAALATLRNCSAASGMTVDAFSDGLVAGRLTLDESTTLKEHATRSGPSELQDAS